MVTTSPEELEAPQVTNLTQSNVESVKAGMVRASQSMINQIEAEETDLQTSIAANVSTSGFRARDSIIGAITAEQAALGNSFAGFVRGEEVGFDGVAGVVVGDHLSSKDMNSIVAVTMNVEASSIRTGLLISQEVHGNVTTTLDGRTTMMAGAVAGAVIGLILLAGKLLFGRHD